MTARLIGLVRAEHDVRGGKDARFKVSRYIYEYRTDNNTEYRRTIETHRGEHPRPLAEIEVAE